MKRSMRRVSVQVSLVTGLLFLCSSGSVSAQEVTVSGKACPFFAGQSSCPTGNEFFYDQVLPEAIPVCGGSVISISAEGTWGHVEGMESGPEGRSDGFCDNTQDPYVNLGGISRVIAPLNTLIGVFLTDAAPDPAALPTSLTLGADDMTTPGLQQAFAIGSNLEYIHVPEGATRLFLGINDGYEWSNNVGSVNVTIASAVRIDIKPETLNLNSKGVFTAFIELPEEFDAEDIDMSTVACAGAPAQKSMLADDGRLLIKFDCEALDPEKVSAGDAVKLTVTGKLTDGTLFAGSDTVRVIDKGGKK